MRSLFGGLFGGKKVLITGHTGFKGSWLSIWMRELGAEVFGYALEPEAEGIFSACRLSEKLNSTVGDVRDYEKLSKTIDSVKPDVVVHMAAQSLVRRSYREPVVTYCTNVMGTVNLLEACRACPSVRVVINVTSDKCYEVTRERRSYTEDDRLGGSDPYSSSKACAELVTTAYRESYFAGPGENIMLSSVRAGNVIGGGDWGEDRLVPDCVLALSAGMPVGIRNPGYIRPWQFVLEPLRGYLMLASALWSNSPKFIGGWNFGPSEENAVTVGEVATGIIEQWGSGSWDDLSAQQAEAPKESTYLKLDSGKARDSLGWSPALCLKESLGMTVQWYKHHFDNKEADMYEFTARQIQEYVDSTMEGK